MNNISELDSWLLSRDHARPYNGSIENLARKAGVGRTVVYDASWGNYKTIPQKLQPYISQEENERFRNEQRIIFPTLELDWPVPFAGFRALAEFWGSGLSAIAKAFGIQRPVLMSFDRNPSDKYQEINAVVAMTSPKNYYIEVFWPFCTQGTPALIQRATPKPAHNPLDFLAKIKQLSQAS